MLVRIHVSLDSRDVKVMEMENTFWKESCPENRELFQMIIKPPEAPLEGRNSYLVNFGGQNFLMKEISETSFLVSWRQIMSQPDSSILFLRATHFFLN